MTDPTLSPQDIISQCAGLTYRKLEYWSNAGIFGPDNALTGSGTRRRFTELDLHIAQIINQVSLAFQTERGGHADLVKLYGAIADLVRSGGGVQGGTSLQVALSPDVGLRILVRETQPT